MAKQYLLDPNKGYYKGNLHGHTTLSDGKTTPEEYADGYREEGYSIIALTDHKRYQYHRKLNTEGLICLAGYEEDIWCKPDKTQIANQERKCYHFNVYDFRPETRPRGYEPPSAPEDYHDLDAINGWIADLRREDLLVCYNHPGWSMQDYRDYAGLKGLWAMEIYNHGCEMEGMYGTSPQVYDEMLRAGQRLVCVASDDNHNVYPYSSQYSDSFGGFTIFNMSRLDYGSVIHAMDNGNLYASTGPLLVELSLDGKRLHVRSSPAHRICVATESRRSYMKVAHPGTQITHADFDLTGSEVYIRVQVQDSAGKYAFSRAYFYDELFL